MLKSISYVSMVGGLFAICFSLGSCAKDESLNEPLKEKAPQIEIVAKDLFIPWGMDFLPDGNLIFSERDGRVSKLDMNTYQRSLLTFRNIFFSEGGLLGLAVDPDFDNFPYIYVYETTEDTVNQVVRLIYNGNSLSEDKVIIENIPAAIWHNGGGMKFGPDGYLYIGTGDAVAWDLPQDKSSLAGKILRVDRDGNYPNDNPYNNEVWSYGHRSVQGFDWTNNGTMYATEHGPTVEFGWCCHDEINKIEPGNNYGWPLVHAGNETDSLTLPILHSGFDTWAPSGCSFIEGKEWGNWNKSFLFGALKEERIIRLRLAEDEFNVEEEEDLLIDTYGRIRSVIQAPDGSILFTTSNGINTNPLTLNGDDRIYRIFQNKPQE